MTRMSRHFQFSIATLLLNVAALAVVLALMFQVPAEIARPAFVVFAPTASALAMTGLAYGPTEMRAFCIGASVPLGMMLVAVTMHLFELDRWFTSKQPGKLPVIFGSGFLASIALGHICLWFRLFIDRPGP